MRIWKYEVPITDEVSVEMPEGARILPHVEMLWSRALNIWAVVDPDAAPTHRTVQVIGTGNNMPEVGTYVGTATDGAYVWHVFEGVD